MKVLSWLWKFSFPEQGTAMAEFWRLVIIVMGLELLTKPLPTYAHWFWLVVLSLAVHREFAR